MIQISTPEKVYEILNKTKLSIKNDIFCTKNFSWVELLVNQTEIPTLYILKNLAQIAIILEKYRNTVFNNSPIKITSGWRSQAYNKKIGGAGTSYHIRGLALDFLVSGYSPAKVQKILDPIHQGGMEFAPNWTHIDIRGKTIRFSA